MSEEIKFLLSNRPSVFVSNIQMRGRLKVECDKLGIKAQWGGCSKCVGIAYKALSTMFNYSFINNLEKKRDMKNYNFRKDIQVLGYRDSKSGLVLRNDSPIELKKAVYDRSESHAALFEPEEIGTIEEIPENKKLTPTSKSKKTTTRKSKKSLLNSKQ